jgi:hypothetical protein
VSAIKPRRNVFIFVAFGNPFTYPIGAMAIEERPAVREDPEVYSGHVRP